MTDRSQLLMTYTTFHIGVYLTLGGGGILLMKSASIYLLALPVVCFLVAGVAGGVIGSNLPEYKDFDAFKDAKIGFWDWSQTFHGYEWWARLEHRAFWLGLLSAAIVLTSYWPPPD